MVDAGTLMYNLPHVAAVGFPIAVGFDVFGNSSSSSSGDVFSGSTRSSSSSRSRRSRSRR